MDLSSLSSGVEVAKLGVAAAGALVVGVVVASKVFHWIELVLIQREADRDYLERYDR